MQKKFDIRLDKDVPRFLYEMNISIMLSTYQAGRIVIIGSNDGVQLHQIPIGFKKPMGVAIEGSKLAVACLDELQFFSNNENIAKTLKINEKNFDTAYVQRAIYNTSNLDIHDIEFGEGVLWGVNTLFSCLCTFDINYSFRPKWKPSFITELVPEDRCHLNGMVLQDGLPKYVTALSSSNEKEGWRKDISKTGVLLEVPSSKVLLDQLSMPHSPILVDGNVYLLESGNGNLIKYNPEKGTKEVVYNFNKFVRGMSHHNGILYIGTSKIRLSSKTFNELDVKDNSTEAGLILFDLNYKHIIGELYYNDTVEEIYDVKIVEGFKKPVIINKLEEKYKDIIVFPKNVFWKKEKKDKQESTQNY